MAVFARPRIFNPKFKFQVHIDGFGSAAFQSCSELSGEFAEISYYEGGAVTANKQPGRMTFSDVTLVRGATTDRDIYNWFRQIGDGASGTGLVTPEFKKNVDIFQFDRADTVVHRWTLFNAWCKKFVAGQWDNNADDIVMESIVLSYDYFELTA
jgi:phage tail-like protein